VGRQKKIHLIHIVDDDEPIRDSTGLLLETLGYGVRTFPSAFAYLNSDVVAGVADCTSLDFQMPRTSGLELLEPYHSGRPFCASLVPTLTKKSNRFATHGTSSPVALKGGRQPIRFTLPFNKTDNEHQKERG